MLDAGDAVTFTAGKETFCPIKFHAFDVGPFTATTTVREGESYVDALDRVKAAAQLAWDTEYEEKLAGHGDRVRRAAAQYRS